MWGGANWTRRQEEEDTILGPGVDLLLKGGGLCS